MSDPERSSKRVLDPIDRVSEVLFGLIMVLTFTGSLSVHEAGRAEVGTMLIGSLGCNLAWGIIDGIFYLMGCLAERGRALLAFRAVRAEADATKGQQIVADALPPLVASLLPAGEIEAIRQRLRALPDPPRRPRWRREDWLGALGVFLLVFLSTFPVVVPFLFVKDVTLAMRISDGIAIVMLFLAGSAFGRITGYRPVLVGLSMVALGAALVSFTIALGG